MRFAMTSPPSGCQGDFHPRAVEHARHTKKSRHLLPGACCHQCSDGKRSVVQLRSASVMIQIRTPVESVYVEKSRKPCLTDSSFSRRSSSSNSPQSPVTCRFIKMPGLSGRYESAECTRRGHDPAQRKPCQLHGRSRKPASLAVARNCGIGSSCLNADVKAFDKLHNVRGWNSSCCGLK